MLTAHIQNLRNVPQFAEAFIFVYIEANMSWLSADMVARILMQFDRVVVAQKDPSPQNRFGVWTGPSEKENYASGLQRVLVDDLLCFADVMIGANQEKDVKELMDQLAVYRKEIKAPTDLMHGSHKIAYGAKSHGRKDDLALALQICLYWMSLTRIDPEFLQLAAQHGWTRI